MSKKKYYVKKVYFDKMGFRVKEVRLFERNTPQDICIVISPNGKYTLKENESLLMIKDKDRDCKYLPYK